MSRPAQPAGDRDRDRTLYAALLAMRRQPSPTRPCLPDPAIPLIPRRPVDPDAYLSRLVDAAVAGDAAELQLAAHDLAVWLQRGGTPPRDPRPTHPERR